MGSGSEPGADRTLNPRLKRPLLCQLSYGPDIYSIAQPGRTGQVGATLTVMPVENY